MKYFIKLILVLNSLFLISCAQQNLPEEDATNVEPTSSPEQIEITAELSNNAPIWQVGDTWRYSDGYELKVSSVRDDETTFQRVDINGDWLVRRGLFKIRSKQGNTHREIVYRSKEPDDLFPLALGKQVAFTEEYLRDGELISRNSSWTVESQETIKVPAGTFKCWIVVMRARGVQSDWTGMERWWYSPDVKNYVRLEYRYGTNPGGARVLMNYKLK